RGSFGGPSGHSYHGRGRHQGGWGGYCGGNHGTSGSCWQQMSGSSFHHGSRESGTAFPAFTIFPTPMPSPSTPFLPPSPTPAHRVVASSPQPCPVSNSPSTSSPFYSTTNHSPSMVSVSPGTVIPLSEASSPIVNKLTPLLRKIICNHLLSSITPKEPAFPGKTLTASKSNHTITLSPSTLPHTPLSQIYFERFSSWLDYQTLRRTFNKYGVVIVMYISRRHNRRNWRSGFVTMQTDSEQQDRLGKLNGIWFGSYRLRANLKRFQQGNTNSQHRIPIKKACSACISTSQGVRLQKLFYGCEKRENQQ
ncbi:hypothetical protein H0E87_005814, partial [Populus deltoides]